MTAKELKTSILQLAVTGKLVRQDPNDEPASVLLDRIKAEKAKLVKAGKIKKDKNPSEIVTGSDGAVYEKLGGGDLSHAETQRRRAGGCVSLRAVEVPFEIPASWRWVRLENLCASIADGDHQPPPQQSEGVPFLVISNVSSGNIDFTSTRFVSSEYFNALTDERKGKRGDLLVTVTGSYGIIVPVETDTAFCFQRHMALLKTIEPYNRYLAYCLQSPSVKAYFDSVATGSAQKTVGLSSLRATLLPLPPFAEQKRIVAKIEQLMPLIEEYGKMEERRLQLDADLPTALEKSILKEAIQGKLVPQDPNDEPASELLKRVTAERKALVKAGKLKANKTKSVIFRGSDRLAYETCNGETVCIQDEIPFDIPDSWEWVRLGNITIFLHRGKSPSYVPHSDYPMFAQKCNQWDGIHLEKCKFCDKAKYTTFQDEYHLRDYDIVVNSTGTGTLGRVGIFHNNELAKHGYLSIVPDSHVTVIRTSLHDLSQYIYQYLRTKFCWEWMNNNADGSTKQKELYTSTLASLLIPIPPLEEQRRITARIPLLLNYCNLLKQQSTT